MEKAVFITKVSQLKYINTNYNRIYYGNEFCERLIPSLKHLKLVLSSVKNKFKFSLVTPYVTDLGLKKIEILLALLESTKISSEVIINDWGVLNLVNRKYPNLTPVLGRLLTKQKKCPRLTKFLEEETKPRLVLDPKNSKVRYLIFKKKLPKGLDNYYKGSNSSSVPIMQDFLFAQRIKRIELDNVAQGLILDMPKNKICASIYLPYICITTTFYCPTVGCDQKENSFLKIKPCNKPCQKYIFTLRHKTMPKEIFLKGNTQFYKNSRLSLKELQNSGVNRIVFEPEIPV